MLNPPEQRRQVILSSSVLRTSAGPELNLTFHFPSSVSLLMMMVYVADTANLEKHEDIKLNQEESAVQLPQRPLGNVVKKWKMFPEDDI